MSPGFEPSVKSRTRLRDILKYNLQTVRAYLLDFYRVASHQT